MKKSLFVLFAALVLICAVACSSIPKASGIRIFASEELGSLDGRTFELKYAKLESEEDIIDPDLEDRLSDIIVTGEELAEGPITILLDPGVYIYEVYVDGAEHPYGHISLKAPVKKNVDSYFVVSEDDIIDYELSCWD